MQGVLQPQLHAMMMEGVSAFPPNNCTDFICIFRLTSFTGYIYSPSGGATKIQISSTYKLYGITARDEPYPHA